MYYHFPVTGSVQKIENQEANKQMNAISSQWEDETTPYGKLHMGVFDWAYSEGKNGIEIKIPNLVNGGSIPKNELASTFFDFVIYGDCFLQPKEDKVKEIDTKFNT